MTESLIDDEQGNFRAGTGCVDEIFTLKQIGEKTCRFYGSEKVYHRVNREALWQLLRMYDVGGKLLNGIKSMYVNSLACVGEYFRIDSVPLVL